MTLTALTITTEIHPVLIHHSECTGGDIQYVSVLCMLCHITITTIPVNITMPVTHSQESCTRNLTVCHAFLYKYLASNRTELYLTKKLADTWPKLRDVIVSLFVNFWPFVVLLCALFAIAFLWFVKFLLYKKLAQVSCTRFLTVCHQHYCHR